MKTKIVIITALISFVTFFLIYTAIDFKTKDKQDTKTNETLLSQSIGCTAPDEPGCEQCLFVADDGCTVFEWTGGEEATAEPWYNSQSVSECNVDVPECASCLKRDKQDLDRIKATQGFNAQTCKDIPSDLIDPCFAPQSTECLCTRYNELVLACEN